MTGGLIFKMELFKFLREKKYMVAVAILASLNTLTTIFYSVLLTTPDYLSRDSFMVRFSSVMIVLLILLVFANGIFLFLFPFHILSIDYKNNVMAMMIASGVNRSKLFFSKIGAVILLSLLVSIIVGIGPFLVIVIQMAVGGHINDFFDGFMEAFRFINFDIDMMAIAFNGIVSVLNSVVIIMAATILMKGKNTAILLSVGFSMASSFIGSYLNNFAFSYDISFESSVMIKGVVAFLSMAIFAFIGLRALQRQNL